MSNLQRLVLHLSAGLVALSGILYALALYFTEGLAALQPWIRTLHIVAAPVLVFALGWIASSHMVPKLWNAMGLERYSGFAVGWIAIPMVLSGYLLQVSGGGFRSAMEMTHWTSAALFVIGYLVHALARNRQQF
jgi:hypothetical protein